MIDCEGPGAKALRWLNHIATASLPGPGVTRLPFTPEHRAAIAIITEWMLETGLAVHLDAAGTLIGRLAGPPGAPVLLMGSHQDSVPQGGRFDGIMGIALPLLALQSLAAKGIALPFAVEVLAFADEEGVRFPTALIGPRALAGSFDLRDLDLVDARGTTLRNAIRDFGLDPASLTSLQRDPAGILAFVECHIEQGPVLDSSGQHLGAVTAICGIERHSLIITGRAAHAGTTPMAQRADALAGAAEIVLAVEHIARQRPEMMATVGTLRVSPGAVNAIAGSVDLTAELRAPNDALRAKAAAKIMDAARRICAERGLHLQSELTYTQPARTCDAALGQTLRAAILAGGGSGALLASGATHDASAMADLCPVAMLFVACDGGISHNPSEHVTPAAMGAAIAALEAVLIALAR